MTGARSGVIVLRAALRCQKTHLKIKRFVGGGGGVRILDDVNHLTDISLQISYQQMYRVECDFIVFWILFVSVSFGQFQMVVVTLSCLLPQTHLHRSCAIIRVIAIFVRGMFDITATNCRSRWRLSLIHHTYLFSANLKLWAQKCCKSNVNDDFK
jgi:hypothetical protein